MSRRRRPQRTSGGGGRPRAAAPGRASAGRPRPARGQRPARRPAPSGPDAAALQSYRDGAAPPLAVRGLLVAALVLLSVALGLRAGGHAATSSPVRAVAAVGLVALMLWLSATFIGHLRGLYAMRRRHGSARPAPGALLRAMSTAPLGLGQSRSEAERILRRVTAGLVVVVLILLVVVQSRGA